MRLEIYIYPSQQVSLPGIYSSISETFRPEYAGKTETPSVEMAPVFGGIEVGWIVVLTVSVVWEVGWVLSEITVVLRLQMRGLEAIPMTRCNGRDPGSSLKKSLDIRLGSCVHSLALRTVAHWGRTMLRLYKN